MALKSTQAFGVLFNTLLASLSRVIPQHTQCQQVSPENQITAREEKIFLIFSLNRAS